MSKEVLLEKLTSQTYRDAFISEEIDIGLPMQLRAMREARGWHQKYIAEKMETKQPRFSLMEKPGYGKFSLNTLKKLASIFNVGLIVSFVPYSEMIDFVDGFSNKRLAAPSFTSEYLALQRRFSKRNNLSEEAGSQQGLDFSGDASRPATPADYKFPTDKTSPVDSGDETEVAGSFMGAGDPKPAQQQLGY